MSYPPSWQRFTYQSDNSPIALEILRRQNFKLPTKEQVPPKTPVEGTAHLKKESKVEVKKEVKVEVKKEVKVEVEMMTERPTYQAENYNRWMKEDTPVDDADFFKPNRAETPKNCPAVTDLSTLFGMSKRLQRFNGLFDKDLYTTHNFAHSVKDQREAILGFGSQKNGYQLLFVVEPDGTSKGILVDPLEAGMFRDYIKKDELKGRKLLLVNLSIPFSQNNGSVFTPDEKLKLKKLVLQANFFNGQLAYTSAEKQTLTNWTAGSALREKFKALFEMIISIHPTRRESYQKSWLKKYLAKIAASKQVHV